MRTRHTDRPRRGSWRRLSFAIAGVTAALLAAGCFGGDGGGSGTPGATATPPLPEAEDAIRTWVAENRNVDYVGDCADAQEGIDVGKLCSTLVGERGRSRAYVIGPTFSEYTATMLLENVEGAGWTVISVENRDPNAPVPGIDWPLAIGDRVVFVGLGENDCLSIREQPSTQANRTICMPDGTEAIIMEGPVDAETYTWWRVAGEGFDGWAVDVYMRLPEAIADLFATPTPAAE